jgi:hypothetical protein
MTTKIKAIYDPETWQFAWFWAIVGLGMPVLVVTIAFLIGEIVGRIWP